MAQAVHASFEFAHRYPDLVGHWLASSNYLVVVSVPDEAALLALVAEGVVRGLATHLVREPDIDDQATAAAFEPGVATSKLMANLPLAGRVLVPT